METIIKDMIENQDADIDGHKLHLEKIEWINKFDSNDKILFHGTSYENIKSILKNGVDVNKQEMSGLIGKGFYLSELIGQSIYYSLKYTYNLKKLSGSQVPLMVFKVNLGNCIDLSDDLSKTSNITKLPGADSHCKIYNHVKK